MVWLSIGQVGFELVNLPAIEGRVGKLGGYVMSSMSVGAWMVVEVGPHFEVILKFGYKLVYYRGHNEHSSRF